MNTVTSKDGTTIAFDQSGQGSAVILVDGALQYRAFAQGMTELADLLAQHFTVIHYDRRGRGDSTDTQPYAVAREIEDFEALIDEADGSAFAYGISSGAALAMEAAIELGSKVRKLAKYEAPYNDDATARRAWKKYRQKLKELVTSGRGGESYPFMHNTAKALANAILNAQHRTLEGQTREVAAEALPPMLVEFFKG